MKNCFVVAVIVLLASMMMGCSSTNLNGFRTEWTGGWVKASPMDTNTPGKVELGMGYGSLTIFPMARGQGAKVTACTYELLSGHPLFAEEIIIYPVGQDSILRLEQSPQSVLRIPWLLDIKAGEPEVTNLTVTPVK